MLPGQAKGDDVTAALELVADRDLDLPDDDEQVDLEEQLIREVRVIVGFLGVTRAGEVLGRSPSWISRATAPNREQRIGSRCRFYIEDLVRLLRAARELDTYGLIEFLAGQAFGEEIPAEEMAEAWSEVAAEQLGTLAEPLRAAVTARALVKRLRRGGERCEHRAPMRTKRAPTKEGGR